MGEAYGYNDPDADIFDIDENETVHAPLSDNEHKHTIDGTVCPTCTTTHIVPPAMLEDLSPQAKERFLSYLDDVPDEVVETILSLDPSLILPSEVLTSFFEFSTVLHNVNSHGPAIRAIIEVLDDMTEGRTSKLWAVYETERRLISAHYALKSANVALVEAENADDPSQELLRMLRFIVDHMVDRISYLTDRYRTRAHDVDYIPHEEIIDSGVFPPGFAPQLRTLMEHAIRRVIDEKS